MPSSKRKIFCFLPDFDRSSSAAGGAFSSSTPLPSSGALLASSERLDSLERRAGAAERRVAHLAHLLAESESENARLAQMSDLLKEEIRWVEILSNCWFGFFFFFSVMEINICD